VEFVTKMEMLEQEHAGVQAEKERLLAQMGETRDKYKMSEEELTRKMQEQVVLMMCRV